MLFTHQKTFAGYDTSTYSKCKMKCSLHIRKLLQDMTCQSPSAVASTLIDLVDQVHDCADIMQHRSLNL